MCLLVILYVWQNIEIVKIHMAHEALAAQERRLLNDNDRLRYEIERSRRVDLVGDRARREGYRQVLPGDCEIMIGAERHAQ